MDLPEYAELRCVSNFSFLRGASQPSELAERAKQLGYSALAITDECSLAGVVRAHVAAKELGFKLWIDSQFLIEPEALDPDASPFTLTVLACHLEGYGNLSEFITKLRRVSEKGTYRLPLGEISGSELEGCVVLVSPKRMATPAQLERLGRWLFHEFRGRCWFAVEKLRLLDAVPRVRCAPIRTTMLGRYGLSKLRFKGRRRLIVLIDGDH